MSDNVLVIPATIRVGREFPELLPLANGDLKAVADCTRTEVGEAVAECRSMTQASRERLETAYREHLKDLELLAQVSAYFERFDEWSAIREGRPVREMLWQVEAASG
jgi:hypothetical protein